MALDQSALHCFTDVLPFKFGYEVAPRFEGENMMDLYAQRNLRLLRLALFLFVSATAMLSGCGSGTAEAAVKRLVTLTWATPASVPYGTYLSATQLNATASVPGTFIYTPALGTMPAVGTDELSVEFIPTDPTSFAQMSTVSLKVKKATPLITWPTPTTISAGTVLSSAQLNATTPIAGSFTYTPAAGTTPALSHLHTHR